MNTATNENQQGNNKLLRILQANLCHSDPAHLHLLNDKAEEEWDILVIQEPHTTYFKSIRTLNGFRQVYPDNELRRCKKARLAIWVNSAISTNSWKALDIPSSVDITAIQFEGDHGVLTLFNIYNSCTDNKTEHALDRYIEAHKNKLYGPGKNVLWCGNFNRHHPLWDDDADDCLFMTTAMDASSRLIQLLAKWDMTMLLPNGIPTLQHWVTNKYSRPDNVFGTKDLGDLVIKCSTLPERRPVKTDHIPIAIILDISTTPAPTSPIRNF